MVHGNGTAACAGDSPILVKIQTALTAEEIEIVQRSLDHLPPALRTVGFDNVDEIPSLEGAPSWASFEISKPPDESFARSYTFRRSLLRRSLGELLTQHVAMYSGLRLTPR